MTNDENTPPPTPSILSFALAPASQVYREPELTDDFLEHILGINPASCILTDNSDLSDFLMSFEEYEECWTAIEKRYKVKLPESGRSSLAKIFAFLHAHGQIEGQSLSQDEFNLDEIKSRPVIVNDLVMTEIVRNMTSDQRQYVAYFGHVIKQPTEIWIQQVEVSGLTRGTTWLRTYIAFFEAPKLDQLPEAVGVAVRFHLRAAWELFSMEVVVGNAAEVSEQMGDRFRFGHRIYVHTA